LIAYEYKDGARLQWARSSGPVAGYYVVYGSDLGHFTRQAAAGADGPNFLDIPGLAPGVTYFFSLGAFDFVGNFTSFTDPIAFTMPGSGDSRPPLATLAIRPETVLLPGQPAKIHGFRFGAEDVTWPAPPYPAVMNGLKLTVNGVTSALIRVSPYEIEFVVPPELAGDRAIL
jgi:hypothetical protein